MAPPINPPVKVNPPNTSDNPPADLTKPPIAVSLSAKAFEKLPNDLVSAAILNNPDNACAPFPKPSTSDPVAFMAVPNTKASAPNFATATTVSGFNLEIYLATLLIPLETSSKTGNKDSPNLEALFLTSFILFLNLNSLVFATSSKASLHLPALSPMPFSASLNTFPPSLAITNPAPAASLLLHNALKSSFDPLTLSVIILSTSAKELPSSIN